MAKKTSFTMTISSDIRKRVLYAKYLLSRSRNAQAEPNELGVAISLLLMHDAVEMLMLAVADHLQLSQNWNFMEFWAKVKESGRSEPSHRIPMGQLNSLRVGLKHKGSLPHSQTVRDLLPRVESFCEDLTRTYLDGLVFADVSLADLVVDEEVRKMLLEARQAYTAGESEDAFVGLRRAFDQLYRSVSHEVPLIKEPPSIRIPASQIPSGLRHGLNTFQAAIAQSAQTLNVLMMGIDPIKYRFFVGHTPHISYSTSGVYQAVLTGTYSNAVFETCFDFVVEASMRISEVFRASSLLL